MRRCKQLYSAGKKQPLLNITVIAVLLVFIVFALNKQGPSPHNGKGTCLDCHLHNPEKSHEDNKKMMKKDVDVLCKQCHQIQQGLSHPSNRQAMRQIPKELPLDWAGRITCVTCHYPHRTDQPDVTGFRIRTETIGRPFCQNCHNDLHDRITNKHSKSLDLSHIGGVGSNRDARAILDQTSLQCLSCHDGTVARTSPVKLPNGIQRGAWQHAKIGLSHPIGVNYPPPYNMRTRYRPTEMLNPKIRLFDGKLGCCTCHEPYSDKKHGLVMSNERSELCLQCHIM